MEAHGQFSTTKQTAMKVAGEVLSHPKAYRAGTEMAETALHHLPRFAIYNRLNAWGRHRDVPAPAAETFHQWFARHRATHEKPRSEEMQAGPTGADHGIS
jgi:L-lactate dehydrogenase complex protein LldF